MEGMFTQQACVPGPVALAVQRYGSGGLQATAVFEFSVAYVTETVRTGAQEWGGGWGRPGGGGGGGGGGPGGPPRFSHSSRALFLFSVTNLFK